MNDHKKLQIFLFFLQFVAIPNEVSAEKLCTFNGKICDFPYVYEGKTYTDECVSSFFGKWCYTDEDASEYSYCIACPASTTFTTTTLSRTKSATTTPSAIESEVEYIEDAVPTIVPDQSLQHQIASGADNETTMTAKITTTTLTPVTEATTTTKRPTAKAKKQKTLLAMSKTTKTPKTRSPTERPVSGKQAKTDHVSETTTTTTKTISTTKKAKKQQPPVVELPSVEEEEGKSHAEETTSLIGKTQSTTGTATSPYKITAAPPIAKVKIPAETTTVIAKGEITTSYNLENVDNPSSGLGTITIVILVLSILFVIVLLAMVFLYLMKLRRSRSADLTANENGTKEPMLNQNGNVNSKQNGKSSNRQDHELQPLNSTETGQGDCATIGEKKNCVDV